jgi:hypothetical protein
VYKYCNLMHPIQNQIIYYLNYFLSEYNKKELSSMINASAQSDLKNVYSGLIEAVT